MVCKNVAITGIGLVSPLGVDVDEVYMNIVQGRDFFQPSPYVKANDQEVYIGNLPESYYDIEKKYYNRRTFKQTILNTRLAVICSHMAWESSKLANDRVDTDRVGVILGTSGASIRDPHEDIVTGAEKFKIIREMTNASSAWVSLEFGITGPSYNVSAAGNSGTEAIVQACDLIRSGVIDIAIAGGSDISTTEDCISFGLHQSIISQKFNTTRQIIPFSPDCDGTILSDGGAVLILQSPESVGKHGSDVFAWIKGHSRSYSYNIDKFLDNQRNNFTTSISNAIAQSLIASRDVQMICANSLPNKILDDYESKSIKHIFQMDIDQTQIISFKPYTGYCIGGAGALDIALSAYSLKNQAFLNKVQRFDQGLNDTHEKLNAQYDVIQHILVNSFSLGGHNSSIILAHDNV